MGRWDDLLEQALGPTPRAGVALPPGHEPFVGHEVADTEGTQSFTLAAGTSLDIRTSFIIGSVIVDNNTSQWINIPDATKDGTGRFVPPGGGGAIPILGHISRARANFAAPGGRTQPAVVAGQSATLIFLAAAIPPGFGIAVPTPPPRWALIGVPAVGTGASVTKAAATGVVHVADAFAGTMFANAVLAAVFAASVTVRDGPVGTGASLFGSLLCLAGPAGGVDHSPPVSSLGIPGTSGNAMSCDFSAVVVNSGEEVSLVGYDL